MGQAHEGVANGSGQANWRAARYNLWYSLHLAIFHQGQDLQAWKVMSQREAGRHWNTFHVEICGT